MNGGQIIGTMDGANVEIAQEVGEENMYIFGCRVGEVEDLKKKMHEEGSIDERLQEVFQAIDSGMFGHEQELKHTIDAIRNRNDWYLLNADFDSYCKA